MVSEVTAKNRDGGTSKHPLNYPQPRRGAHISQRGGEAPLSSPKT